MLLAGGREAEKVAAAQADSEYSEREREVKRKRQAKRMGSKTEMMEVNDQDGGESVQTRKKFNRARDETLVCHQFFCCRCACMQLANPKTLLPVLSKKSAMYMYCTALARLSIRKKKVGLPPSEQPLLHSPPYLHSHFHLHRHLRSRSHSQSHSHRRHRHRLPACLRPPKVSPPS